MTEDSLEASPPDLDVREGSDVAVRTLATAYTLLQQGWCQGVAALDGRGKPVEAVSPAARSWSAAGALEAAWGSLQAAGYGAEELRSGLERAELALAVVIGDELVHWNDAPEIDDDAVLAAFMQALDRAERLRDRQQGPQIEALRKAPAPAETNLDEVRRELGSHLVQRGSARFGGERDGLASAERRLVEATDHLEQNIRELPPRRTAQLVATLMHEAAEVRLRRLTTLSGQLSEDARHGLATALRLPPEGRRAMGNLLHLPEAERTALASMLHFSAAECRALALILERDRENRSSDAS